MSLAFEQWRCLMVPWDWDPRSIVMATERIDDLRAFRDSVDAQLGNGGSGLTPEECLELWIVENCSDEEREETLVAIRQGLEDMYAGRTRPARDALEAFGGNHPYLHRHELRPLLPPAASPGGRRITGGRVRDGAVCAVPRPSSAAARHLLPGGEG